VLKTGMTFVDFAHAAYVDFSNANFRPLAHEPVRCPETEALLASLLYRPTIFQRKDVRWIAAHAWRSQAKERGLRALKVVKDDLDPFFIREAAKPLAALICQLFGTELASAVTCVPCGHSCRPDCFGKRLAQAVGEALAVPFVQVFADQPRAGTSHPKQSSELPPLRQIARPPRSTIVVDDLATSGVHLEQAVLALRRMGVAASAIAWISGSRAEGAALADHVAGLRAERLGPLHAQTALDAVAMTAQSGRNASSGLQHPECSAV
jgi:hypothetical protein